MKRLFLLAVGAAVALPPEFLIRTIDVPEPTPLLLLLSGVFILFGGNRRRFGVEV